MSINRARVGIARWSVAVVATVLALVFPAHADESDREAEKLIRHGIELRKAHDDESAMREFQKAYDLVHSPRAAAQLGLAEQELGRWEDAERHIEEAVRAGSDPWVAKNRSALEEALGTIQAHLGRVDVSGDPAGAEVSVNGRSVGTLPLPDAVKVSAGQVDVEMRAPGYVAAQRTLTIVGGQYQRLVVHLAKESAPETAPKPAATPEVMPPPVEPTPAAPGTQPSGVRPILKWGAAGLAGAGLAAGVVFTILHSNNVNKFDQHPCYVMGGTAVTTGGQPDTFCTSTLSTSKTYQDLMIGGYVAAGAFAVTWLVLQLTEPSSSGGAPGADRAARGPICAPAFADPGISCAVRF